MGTWDVEVLGEQAAVYFQRKHPKARKPLARFLNLVRDSAWMNLIDLKETFASADYVPASGMIVFNIGGNTDRLTATVNFERQRFLIDTVMTHEEYDRKEL